MYIAFLKNNLVSSITRLHQNYKHKHRISIK